MKKSLKLLSLLITIILLSESGIHILGAEFHNQSETVFTEGMRNSDDDNNSFLTSNLSNDYTDSTSIEEFYDHQKEIKKITELVKQCNNLEDVFARVPALREKLHRPEALSYLYGLYGDESYRDKECIAILIVYIESGFSITDIHTLSLLSPNFNSIMIITRSSKKIKGLVLTGSDTASPHGSYPGATAFYGTQTFAYNCHSYAWYYRGNFNTSDKIWINEPNPYSQHCYHRSIISHVIIVAGMLPQQQPATYFSEKTVF